DAAGVIEDIASRGKSIIVAGGSGLYIRALTRGLFDGPPSDSVLRGRLEGLEERMGRGYLHSLLEEADPALAEKIHPNNRVRIMRALEVCYLTERPMSRHQAMHGFNETPYRLLTIGLAKERDRLYRDIDARVERMIDAGLEDEVRGLLDRGYGPSLKPMQGLGYKEMVAFLQGECARDEAVVQMKKKTRNYAKRQLTWFRREEDIEWFPGGERDSIRRKVGEFLQ
ncbi:MAG: tRNA (adenosine(37)-N6)-dimethylallyltransferase MiaA, partial [Thermodesulfobacteriota bacterium]